MRDDCESLSVLDPTQRHGRAVASARFNPRLQALLRLVLSGPVTILISPEALATNYYLSLQGNDSSSGTSASSPWKSLSRANQVTYSPGDQILLRGGDAFSGGLYFDSRD